MKQERHEYINKGNAVYCLVETKKSDLTLNYLVYPKKRDAGKGSEVEMMKEAGSTFTGSHFTTISQHFLPPPVVEFYFITFTHSYSLCLLLSTVAETVSHFKEWESGFKKKKVASFQPLQRPLSVKPDLSLFLSFLYRKLWLRRCQRRQTTTRRSCFFFLNLCQT